MVRHHLSLLRISQAFNPRVHLMHQQKVRNGEKQSTQYLKSNWETKNYMTANDGHKDYEWVCILFMNEGWKTWNERETKLRVGNKRRETAWVSADIQQWEQRQEVCQSIKRRYLTLQGLLIFLLLEKYRTWSSHTSNTWEAFTLATTNQARDEWECKEWKAINAACNSNQRDDTYTDISLVITGVDTRQSFFLSFPSSVIMIAVGIQVPLTPWFCPET